MSRFGDIYDYDPPEYPNSGDLWWANIKRALQGKRGQRDLRDLEAALLELPEKRLISGHVALNGQVCAVGALAVRRRCEKGEPREQVLAAIETTSNYCECGHPREQHGADGRCVRCIELQAIFAAKGRRGAREPCAEFHPEPLDDGGDTTAMLGKSVGMTYALAWRVAYLNDEDFTDCTPEERYDKVLAWVREQLQPEKVEAA